MYTYNSEENILERIGRCGIQNIYFFASHSGRIYGACFSQRFLKKNSDLMDSAIALFSCLGTFAYCLQFCTLLFLLEPLEGGTHVYNDGNCYRLLF